MDAYLICPETRKSLWLGKPIRSVDGDGNQKVLYYHATWEYGISNFEDPQLNKVLWKFLAEHAGKVLQILCSGAFDESVYESVACDEIAVKEYLAGWPNRR